VQPTAGSAEVQVEPSVPQIVGPVDPSSAEPLYRQVRTVLLDAVERGVFHRARPLPSSRFLAAQLGVSRNTVTLAYQELVALGTLESRPRSGLYVSSEVRPRGEPVPPPGPSTRPAARPAPAHRVEWAARVRRSEDDLAALVEHPDWNSYPYPFVAGQPELRQFPVRGWLRALSDALSGPHLAASLGDASGGDDPLLVQALCREVLPARGVRAEPDQVLITNGSQQALFLLAEALLGPGREVAVEDPGYLDAWHIFHRTGARLRPVPVDGRGMLIDERDGHGGVAGSDVVYVTPSHQHPTNVTLSLPRRRRLLELARVRDMIVIEDDYDSEFRYRGRPTPSLKSLDTEGRVAYVGTFSKFLAAGLRVGFVVADAELVRELRDRRRYSTKHLAGHVQRALGLFIASGEYHRVLRRHHRQLRVKWETLTGALGAQLPFPVDPPAGGLSIWLEGPPELDGARVVELARLRGVLVEAGAHRYFGEGPRNNLRIGFSAIPQQVIEPGVARLALAVREALAGS